MIIDYLSWGLLYASLYYFHPFNVSHSDVIKGSVGDKHGALSLFLSGNGGVSMRTDACSSWSREKKLDLKRIANI